MQILFLIFHVISCLILILVILLQSGKGADLASTFGVSGSQTTFGPRGQANLLTRVTTAAAVVFMLTSLGLAILLGRPGSGSSVMSGSAGAPAKSAPAKRAPVSAPVNVPVPAVPAGTPSKAIEIQTPDGKTVPAQSTILPASQAGYSAEDLKKAAGKASEKPAAVKEKAEKPEAKPAEKAPSTK